MDRAWATIGGIAPATFWPGTAQDHPPPPPSSDILTATTWPLSSGRRPGAHTLHVDDEDHYHADDRDHVHEHDPDGHVDDESHDRVNDHYDGHQHNADEHVDDDDDHGRVDARGDDHEYDP